MNHTRIYSECRQNVFRDNPFVITNFLISIYTFITLHVCITGNTSVQYVLMCDFCCFSYLLFPLVRPFSDCDRGWQMCPVVIFVSTVYFKTQICSGLCVSACCLGSIHPLTRASPPLTSPSQEMTGECNPPQSLFCSLNPPTVRHVQMRLPPACQLKSCLYLVRT